MGLPIAFERLVSVSQSIRIVHNSRTQEPVGSSLKTCLLVTRQMQVERGNKVGEFVRRTMPSTGNFLESRNLRRLTAISTGGVASKCCASHAGLILVPHGVLRV